VNSGISWLSAGEESGHHRFTSSPLNTGETEAQKRGGHPASTAGWIQFSRTVFHQCRKFSSSLFPWDGCRAWAGYVLRSSCHAWCRWHMHFLKVAKVSVQQLHSRMVKQHGWDP